MIRPKLIASDLDGTFLSSGGQVSEENSAAVLAAQEVGIPVLFATGRPVRWLDVIADLPGGHPTVIVSNGAALYDLGSREMSHQVFISPDVALSAIEEIRRVVQDATFALESGIRFGFEAAYRTWTDGDVPEDAGLFSGTVEEILEVDDYVKMLVQSHELGADELLLRVKRVVQDRLTATHSQSAGRGLVEISAPGVSKAAMLRRVCAELGIDASEVAAFGDMPNDIEMLTWVGMPHVVANAHPALLEMDIPVVASNDESGVGRTIQSWLAG
ncbi:HAD family hydrolase [Microlunatus panaciterrae]|uniref:Cof subfamily protein (Haloacid dehalogenase superfamily) n=1 Tax=Microlunatus panaciterrae TaxID=400768 RepID=A0ABS2RGG2_9ACTN|nr:HAD family hydrolase [Microlunatus panaciterrae]MBM7797617.1 Cof subfamily protein (haloacid dehalogenase superfamily) [Microlunatus panaciterrae]